MSIKHAFIPSAGLGSRMGDVGKVYPKPLWPLFDSHLLELQCAFLEQYGVRDFIINTHFLSNVIEEKLKSYRRYPIKRLYEDFLLGTGGSFFNLKEKEKKIKKIIVLNSDVQIFLSDRDRDRLSREFESHDSVMVCIPVRKNSGYNKVNFNKSNYFNSVTKASGEDHYFTYSGFSMVNLSLLEGEVRPCSFFEAIVNNDFFETKIFIPKDKYEYWDWGTLELYLANIKMLTLSNDFALWRHLVDKKLIDLNKIGQHSYHHDRENIYNFTGEILRNTEIDPGVYFKNHLNNIIKIKL